MKMYVSFEKIKGKKKNGGVQKKVDQRLRSN